MELTKNRLIAIIVGGIVVVILALYLIIYAPVIADLKSSQVDYSRAETHAALARERTSILKGIDIRKGLIEEESVSAAIDEIAKKGKEIGVNFVSITPADYINLKHPPCRILPIRMEITSTYEQIGTFLGFLDDLEKSLVAVKNFTIIPSQAGIKKLKTHLVVKIHVSI